MGTAAGDKRTPAEAQRKRVRWEESEQRNERVFAGLDKNAESVACEDEAQGRCAKKQPAMCLSSKKYTGKVNAFEMKNGAESWAHFEWTWTEAITFRYATKGITGT